MLRCLVLEKIRVRPDVGEPLLQSLTAAGRDLLQGWKDPMSLDVLVYPQTWQMDAALVKQKPGESLAAEVNSARATQSKCSALLPLMLPI